MTQQGLIRKIALVIIAIALPLIGFSAASSKAVQTRHQMVTIPLEIPPSAMVQTAAQADRSKQITCLARNIYFEARGESTAGQLAVGLVTINRTKSTKYPSTICAVVWQPHQFSWRWDRVPDLVRHPIVYARIHAMATFLYDDYYVNDMFPDIVDGATHFHTIKVHPAWKGSQVVVRIGNHIFYKFDD